ncbi:MAG: hypothetical protein IJ468_02350 [Lachnospiraceae bacterium]|nr:hypothetical protein [Lachnospiraceae bacterium]
MSQEMKLLYAVLIAAVIGFIIYQIVSKEKRIRNRFLRQIASSWGALPNREYDFGELEHIARYYENTKEEGYTVDEITWNDLDMDSVYSMINNCRNSCGDDYLYKMLHTPLKTKAELDERKRVINYFANHESIRTKYQLELSKVGHTRKFAMIEYVKTISGLIPDSNLGNYLQLLMYPAAIVLIILDPAIGILFALGALIYNIYTYFKTKSSIEPYYVTVGAIVHLVSCAQGILKLDVSELREYTSRLKDSAKILNSVKKDSKFLGSVDKMSGDMSSLFADYLNMFLRLDLIKFNRLVTKLQKHKADILVLMEEIGRLDAYITIASFREMLPFWCEAELEETKSCRLEAKDLYHPLLSEPVANSICVEKPVLLTGSNASGKSTFLKTVAINSLLAQTCGMALAHSFSSSFFRIYSSMALKDNLQGSESYFIVEIKSLKRIMDAVGEEERPVICFVDEVLRGTNTVERIAASSRILQNFAKQGVMCFAATHDIELTHMLEDQYANYHFKEDVVDNDVIFNYRLYEGRATSRNAIKLLGVLGYDEAVIKQADETAKRFLEKGVWSLEG